MKASCGFAALLFGAVYACPDHNVVHKRESSQVDYSYYKAQDWGHLKNEYALCQTGTMQTPIQLAHAGGYADTLQPIFNYPSNAKGYIENSGFSLSYTLSTDGNTTSLPSLKFGSPSAEPEDVYLIGWHLHAPSEHVIDGKAARAEMHFVHTDTKDNARSVLAFLIEPSSGNGTQSAFFDQIPQPFPAVGSNEKKTIAFNPTLAIKEVGNFRQYWAYKGSLTTPPCSEGLRWFVAAQPLLVDNDMMEQILAVSTFSARPIQPLWMHELNK